MVLERLTRWFRGPVVEHETQAEAEQIAERRDTVRTSQYGTPGLGLTVTVTPDRVSEDYSDSKHD
jgi:hypothetical protein